MKDRDAETVESSTHGLEGHVAETLENEHKRFQDTSKNLGVQVIQSWPAKESSLFPVEKYNEMGLELARRVAPGHLAWVVTHTEREHIHNHVIISSVHSDTGKRLQNKKSFLFQIRDANDQIAKENGLSVLEPSWKVKDERLPEKVRTMVAHGKSSWRHDLNQKASFARAASTSFDEYVATLKVLGVHARVEEKNVSYVYGDREKAIRGKGLGTKYSKEGLVKAFQENDERFAGQPGLRAKMKDGLSQFTPGNAATPDGVGTLNGLRKDYGQYTKVSRARTRGEIPAVFAKGGFLAEELKKAQEKSIFDYCKENKIGLRKDKAGNTILIGLDSIVVKDKTWKNTRNHTSGGLVEFVTLHDKTNYLRAVAKINNNSRLLLLEPVLGEYSTSYRSFYFPTNKKAPPSIASQVMSQFLRDTGRNPKHADIFAKDSRLIVTQNLSLWIRGDRDGASMEFSKGSDGTWKSQSHGNPHKGFHEVVGRSAKLTVFTDPFEFIISTQKGSRLQGARDSLFVMMNENSKSGIHEILFSNPHIKEVQVVSPSGPNRDKNERPLFHDLKSKLTPFDIQVQELTLEGLTLSRERGHSPSL